MKASRKWFYGSVKWIIISKPWFLILYSKPTDYFWKRIANNNLYWKFHLLFKECELVWPEVKYNHVVIRSLGPYRPSIMIPAFWKKIVWSLLAYFGIQQREGRPYPDGPGLISEFHKWVIVGTPGFPGWDSQF